MELTNATLAEIARNLRADWKAGMQWTPPVDLSNILFWDVPGAGASNMYFWAQNAAGFREWVGDRVFNDVLLNKFIVEHITFEKTDRLPRNAIKDDTFGAFGDTVRMSSQSWSEQKYQLVIDVLTGNPVCFDGKTFFATDHKYGKNTIANKVTTALTAAVFNTAYETAGSWKFADGVLCRPRFTHLLYGPALRATVAGLINSQYTDAQLTANPNYKAVTPVEISELSGDYKNYWYLVDGSRPIKPICRQIREDATPFIDARVEQVERTGYMDCLATGRAAACGTMPHLIYAGIVAA
jgi:phage major head subunit gpT-like protein